MQVILLNVNYAGYSIKCDVSNRATHQIQISWQYTKLFKGKRLLQLLLQRATLNFATSGTLLSLAIMPLMCYMFIQIIWQCFISFKPNTKVMY